MAGDKFKKVQAGKPLEISANTWNSMVDAARSFSEGQHNQTGEAANVFRQGDVVKVRNKTGQDIARFGILGLSDVIIKPSDNLLEFSNRPAFDGIVPNAHHAGRFAVALSPAKPDAIIPCMVSGVTPVRVNVLHAEAPNWFADVSVGSTQHLQVNDQVGSARILWREHQNAGVQWAVIRLSNNRLPLTLTAELQQDLYSSQVMANVKPYDLSGLALPVIPAWNAFRLAANQFERVAIYWDDSPQVKNWVIVQVVHKSQYVVESLRLSGGAYGGSSSGCDCQTLIAMRRKVQVAYCESESKLEPFAVGQVCACGSYSSGGGGNLEMMQIEMPE